MLTAKADLGDETVSQRYRTRPSRAGPFYRRKQLYRLFLLFLQDSLRLSSDIYRVKFSLLQLSSQTSQSLAPEDLDVAVVASFSCFIGSFSAVRGFVSELWDYPRVSFMFI